jgi:hypothetical protein
VSKSRSPAQKSPDGANENASPERTRVAARDREANSRVFAYLLISFLARADQLRRKHFEDDIDLAVIAEAVAMAAIDPRMRDPDFVREFRNIDNLVGLERQRGVNALSIAAATGIPRETARRKIKRLLAMGVLAETGRGKYVLKPGYIQQPVIRNMFEELTRASVRFVNDCLDQRVLQVASAASDQVEPQKDFRQ